jgi:hypothetical protein
MSAGMALDYDKNGVPVLDRSRMQIGSDANKSVIRARNEGGINPPVSKVNQDQMWRNGNGNPDYMLGTLMNPIMIAPSFVSGGVPRSCIAAVRQGLSSVRDDVLRSIIGDIAEEAFLKNGR